MPGRVRTRSALPKARVVALAECGTHAFLAAEAGAWAVGEKTLANPLYQRLRPDELLTADRNFYGFDAWGLAVRSGGGAAVAGPHRAGAADRQGLARRDWAMNSPATPEHKTT
jgi:hypothetical protein